MDSEHADQPIYAGQSHVLRHCPPVLMTGAVLWVLLGSVAGAIVFAVPALVTGLLLPWRFAVYRDGIHLWFNFGKRRALPRDRVTVRANRGGVVVMPRGAQRGGYPLTNGLLDHDRLFLGDVFRFCGFDVVG